MAGQRSDDGSVLPLVLGLVVCLLLLGAGVTAATSAFLARNNLQHMCDGAAGTAADTAQRTGSTEQVITAATDYLTRREATAAVAVDAEQVTLTCTGSSAITFGTLFGVPELTFTVSAAGRSLLP